MAQRAKLGKLPSHFCQSTRTQETELTHVSLSYTAPYAEVQRARIVLWAHHHPAWSNTQIARTVGCARDTVKTWRRRWHQQGTVAPTSRPGAPRHFAALVRAQIVALACSPPATHGKVWRRWSGEKLAQVAVEKGIVATISPSTIRGWLRQDKIKPWRYHSGQHSTDPQFVEKATPVLDLYAQAQALHAQGGLTVCADEKTSIQARQRVTATKAAAPDEVMQVADRYKRMGMLQLFCALAVDSGLTFAQTRTSKKFVDFKAFLQAFFQSALCVGVQVLHLILDNGPTHAPKQLGTWLASLELAFEVRLYWLPKYASWLDQVEIIFSKVQRALRTPNDFPSTIALERDLRAYFAELNEHPKPIKWTYTKTKLLAKFGSSPPTQLAA
jgi:transposase